MIKVIGVSGVARSGKDTMAQALKEILEENEGIRVEIRSLAAPLKSDIYDFILERFGIDVFDCTDEEKKLIRPLLVGYGGAKRAQTQGKYWTSLMDLELAYLAEDNVSVVIIPDIRYCDFEDDEVGWLLKKSGFLIHVSKELKDGTILQPANEDEERNDPVLQRAADFSVLWPEQDFQECKEVARTLLGYQ